MKMMCIKGRLHPAHTGLFAGRVYEVEMVTFCQCMPVPDDCGGKRALAQGSAFLRPVRMRCRRCGARMVHALVPWDPLRFIKWDDPQVGEKEVRELYAPPPKKKEAVDG